MLFQSYSKARIRKMVLSSSAEYLLRGREALGESVDVGVIDEMTLRHCT